MLAFLLAGCETPADGDSAAPSPTAVSLAPSRGLGFTAAGGLLGRVAEDGAVKPIGAKIEGRILQGGYSAQLSGADRRRAEDAALVAFESLPAGQTKIWRNPNNGHWGTMTPWRTYMDATGQYCREYRQTVTLGGLEHQANGTVCRRGDGVWQVRS